MISLQQYIYEVNASKLVDKGTAKNIFIGCGKAKKSVRSKASELYTGAVFQKQLEYARACTSDSHIYILSAKHHILRLDSQVDPYNVTLNDMSEEQRDEWAQKVVSKAKSMGITIDNQYFIAGANYIEPLEKLIKVNNIAGGAEGLGYKLQQLDRAMK